MKITKRVLDRMKPAQKKYAKVVESIRERDVSEADTVTVVKDVLEDILGYDKYLELTGEQQIRGTFCDLAVKIDGKIRYLIEVKAAGVVLNESHLRQAVDYGAKEGIEWVVLTNSAEWQLHRIKFGQPIEHELVTTFDLTTLDLRLEEDQRKLFLLSRESISENAMDKFHQQAQLLNGYVLAQIMTSDKVVSTVRREFRRLFKEVKVEQDDLLELIVEDVLKRDVTASEKAKEARKVVRKAERKLEKSAKKKTANPPPSSVSEDVVDSAVVGHATTEVDQS